MADSKDDETTGRALDDWLHAEQQMVWRPAIELRRTNGTYIVEAAVAGVEASQIDLQASSSELLIAATLHHGHPSPEPDDHVLTCEFANGPLFRSLRFPEPVDPKRVKAEVRNGLLRVTAPLAERAKVDVTAAER